MTTTTNPHRHTDRQVLAALATLATTNDDFMIDLIEVITDDCSTAAQGRIDALLNLLSINARRDFLISYDICPLHHTDLDTCADDDRPCPFIA
jgi:hypothetical protein